MMNSNKGNRSINGFSLIELSIVILVLSVVAAASLNILSITSAVEKSDMTAKKMDRVAEMIAIYAKANGGKLPCPAKQNISFENSEFGKSAVGSPCSGDLEEHTSTNVVSGMVPILTVGLSPEDAFDEWGRRITYVMDQDLAVSLGYKTTPNIDIRTDVGSSNLSEKRSLITYAEIPSYTPCYSPGASPVSVSVGDEIPKCAAFLLISYGPNSSLAYSSKGTLITIGQNSLSELELENSAVTQEGGLQFDNIFISEPAPSNSGEETSIYYDDIVVYRTNSAITP